MKIYQRLKKGLCMLLTAALLLPGLPEEDVFAVSSAASGPREVTYEITGNYRYNIYANGQPLLVEVSSADVRYGKLYRDVNRNGIGEAEEEITSFASDSGGGMFYLDGYGYWLTNSNIYGGAKEGSCQYDTSVTVTGTSDTSENYSFWAVYGGNAGGTLTGNTHVKISGGNIGYLYGGGGTGVINGNTSVEMTGGCVLRNMYGGSASGQVNGNTGIHIKNGKVNSVYGGNENSGKITGNTQLVFEEGAMADGWIYGGGAGYSSDAVTEVAGSTNIVVNGGIFNHNIYGGGGWRGARTGSVNITVNSGTFNNNSWIYGGGEEESVVDGRVFMQINGGDMYAICPSGASYNGTTAKTGGAEIELKGGSLSMFSALPNDRTVIGGDITLALSGNSFSDTELFFGRSSNPNGLQNVSVSIKDGAASLLCIQSPIEESLQILLENGDAGNLVLLENVLADTKKSSLSYVNCGTKEGRWGCFVQESEYAGYFADRDNPVLKGSNLNGNQFDSISMKNSYVNFQDDSVLDGEYAPWACAGKLLLDGGALRAVGKERTSMPETEFLNQPLLLRTSNYRTGFYFGKVPAGQAKIQWLHSDGETVPEEDRSAFSIAETPENTPESTFLAAHNAHVIKTEMILIGGDGWQRQEKAWYTDIPERLCRCSAYSSHLTESRIFLPEGCQEETVTLKDVRTDSTEASGNCPVVGHKGTAAVFTYKLLEEGTTAPAQLKGDLLTVRGTGMVHVEVHQNLNGRTFTYDAYLPVIRVPAKNSFAFTTGMEEDVKLSFSGVQFNSVYSYIWNNLEHKYVDIKNYSAEIVDGELQFCLKKEFLESLGAGEYSFHANAFYYDEEGKNSWAEYAFTVRIAPPVEVEDPIVEVLPDRVQYDGTAKEPEVVVKDGDVVIPTEEYTVSYRNNVEVGTAFVTITDKPGGNYIINGNGSGTFEIVNDYEPENGVDYTDNLNENGWAKEDFVIQAGEGYLLSMGNKLTDEWVESLAETEETDGDSITFYVKNTGTGAISLPVTESYKIDRTDPESCDIRFQKDSVKRLLHEITFGLFFRETVEVEITAEDALSGIEEIVWYQSEELLSREQLEKITDWSTGSLSLTPEDEKRVIVYVKAADRAGNTVYFASEGAEFDLTAPVVSGIEDGAVYYTTQKVEVTDKNIEKVTLNGQEVSESFRLTGNVKKTYEIRAVDRAGNETLVTVEMKPIQSLADEVEGITEENVTTDHKASLEKIKQEIEKMDMTGVTQEEKEELQSILDTCNTLLKKIAALYDAKDDAKDDAEDDAEEPDKAGTEVVLKKTEKTGVPRTADKNRPILWLVCLIVSGSGAVLLTKKRGKNKNRIGWKE